MALKQLMIGKKIERAKSALTPLLEREAALKQRSADAEKAIEEAQTEEEIAAVEEETAAIETEQADVDKKKGDLEAEITALETELEELNNKAPDNKPAPLPAPSSVEPEQRSRTPYQGGETRMKLTFREMNFEQRAALVARSDVKEFLTQVRELGRKSQQRAVNGAELTFPLVLLSMIRDNLHRYSKLITRVNLQPVPGKARQNIMGAVPEAIWTEACATLNELTLFFGQIEVDGYKVGGFVPVCNATLEDSDESLAAAILDAISQAIGLATDKAILYGTGKKMPLGIVPRLAQASQPSDWSANSPAWKDLRTTNIRQINMTSLDAEAFFAALVLAAANARANYTTSGRKFWAMNTQTHAMLTAKMVSLNASGALVSAMNMTMPIVGGDIVILEFIPDGDIVGGYGELYLLAERAGIQLAQSEHVRFIEDQTVFKGTARYDGRPVFGEGFVVMNINNVAPATSVPFAPDNANPEDAYLDSLAIGSLTLTPAFNPAISSYTAGTTNASNTVTVDPDKDGAKVEIKVNGSVVTNGGTATWTAGANTVEVKVTYGTTTRTYSVAVTKS